MDCAETAPNLAYESVAISDGPAAAAQSSLKARDAIIGGTPGRSWRFATGLAMLAGTLGLAATAASAGSALRGGAAPLAPPAPLAPQHGPARVVTDDEVGLNFISNAICGLVEVGATYVSEHSMHVPNVPSMEACCQRCQKVKLCDAWTWVTVTGLRVGEGHECHLKSGKLYNTMHKFPESAGGGTVANLIAGKNPKRPQPPWNGPDSSPYIFNTEVVRAGPQPNFTCMDEEGPMPKIKAPRGGHPMKINVLSYNLMWWQVFDKGFQSESHFFLKTKGNGATDLINKTSVEESKKWDTPFDVIGFQECMDVVWLLDKSGLSGEYSGEQGGEETCMAYRHSTWELLGKGQVYVAEDGEAVFWRRRVVMWLRLKHKVNGRTMLFVNHHGPLPIATGGKCGPVATARKILSVISEAAHDKDVVVLVGDFNSGTNSKTLNIIQSRMTLAFQGVVDGGIDNIFTNLDADSVVSHRRLGGGGSDHDAIFAVLQA